MKKKIALLIGCLLPMSIWASGNIKACAGCHGDHFEKKALGKSKVVANMSEEEIKNALQGYKDKTYGGPMKAIMYGQISKIGDINHAAKNIYNISHGEKLKPNKEKCIAKLDSIKNCVTKASSKEDMQKCRIQLVKFSEKVKSMHNIK